MSRKMISSMAAILGMAAMSGFPSGTNYQIDRPRKQHKSFEEDLKSKGLQEFEINGTKIIAHNLDEAIKRYKHRNK